MVGIITVNDHRQRSISIIAECRHLWMDGICMKCGVKQEEVQTEIQKEKKAGDGHDN